MEAASDRRSSASPAFRCGRPSNPRQRFRSPRLQLIGLGAQAVADIALSFPGCPTVMIRRQNNKKMIEKSFVWVERRRLARIASKV